MADLSSVDVALDDARAAFDSSIDGVRAAVQAALDVIHDQVECLEGVHAEREEQRDAVASEIDVLAHRAAQLEALVLPAPLAPAAVYDQA